MSTVRLSHVASSGKAVDFHSPSQKEISIVFLEFCPAVIEEENGVLTYWALKHPPDKLDFHHPDAFAVELEPLNMLYR